MTSYQEILSRIDQALDAALVTLEDFTPGAIEASKKEGGDPVTAADTAVNERLLRLLPRSGEGWLSEETADDHKRLESKQVWVVDPLDGTREFVAGIPEWCVSIGYVDQGKAVAGGIYNPATGEKILGYIGGGITYNGGPPNVITREDLHGALVVASRSEVNRGEWERFQQHSFTVQPMGSVAYKLGLVAAGRVDASWTLVPKHEWDIAAGVALVHAAGGFAVYKTSIEPPTFNNSDTLLPGLIAGPSSLRKSILDLLRPYM